MKLFKQSIVILFTILALLLARVAGAVSGTPGTLLQDTTLDATTTGSPLCLPRQSDDFVLYLKAVNSAGSSPTLDVTIQHSDDESNWFTLDTFTQATTGTSSQVKQINSASTHLLKCVRAVATLGGTGSPSYNTTIKIFYRVRN